jgi:hypothetical protein
MIYDSVRQSKPAIRNTFGVGRFNTRLNFYFYEAGRVSFIQRKSFFLHRRVRTFALENREFNYININSLESTAFSYVFIKK